mmetsp:Transcript_12767/g.39199  ORF Transcript_12767/g.39199 Transcript_12767/m.39199 type:complete len:180 (-) Transcript_12767:979-1518(-)
MSVVPKIYKLDAKGFGKTLPRELGCLLGVDYGKRSIGVACSDPSRSRAFAYGALQSVQIQNVARHLQKIAQETAACGLVLGLAMPSRRNPGDGFRQQQVDTLNFLAELYRERFYNGTKIVSCLLWHEEFSTVSARLGLSLSMRERIAREGTHDRVLKGRLDTEAARFILQDALDNIRGP